MDSISGDLLDFCAITNAAREAVNRTTGGTDAEDLLQDRAFALEAWEDFQAGWESFSPPGNFPYKEGGKGGSFTPSTTQACTHCGLCVRQCPMQAIGEDCAAIDREKCIACGKCERVCPMNVEVPNNSRRKKNATECILCMKCIEECPQNALKL